MTRDELNKILDIAIDIHLHCMGKNKNCSACRGSIRSAIMDRIALETNIDTVDVPGYIKKASYAYQKEKGC